MNKISRIALLSVLFVAPMFADDAANATAQAANQAGQAAPQAAPTNTATATATATDASKATDANAQQANANANAQAANNQVAPTGTATATATDTNQSANSNANQPADAKQPTDATKQPADAKQTTGQKIENKIAAIATEVKDDAKGFFGKGKDLVVAGIFLPITMSQFVANKSYLNDGIKAVTSRVFAQDSFFNKNAENFGTGLVFTAAAAAVLYAYNTYYAAQDTADDNDPFANNEEYGEFNNN